jgi:hypothetical protein
VPMRIDFDEPEHDPSVSSAWYYSLELVAS